MWGLCFDTDLRVFERYSVKGIQEYLSKEYKGGICCEGKDEETSHKAHHCYAG